MTFLHPALLAAGLAAVSIPIIIHLLMHRRRKPVMWGAMRFLMEAYRRQRRRLMVEKWLLLACRCLVLALLAFAIGRPLLGALGVGTAGRTVYILIDNGVASASRDAAGSGTALERHKAAARAVISSLRSSAIGGGESDRVGLIALGGPADGLVVPASPNTGSVTALLDALEPTDSRTDLQGGLALVAQALAPVGAAAAIMARPDRTLVVILSDFLEGSLDLSAGADAPAVRLPEGVRVVASTPLPAAPGNVSITAVEPLRSVLVDTARAAGASGEVTELVRVALRRSGDSSAAAQTTVRARLAFPGQDGGRAETESPAERAVVRWSPGQETATAIVPVRTDRRPGGGGGGEAGPGPGRDRQSGAAVIVASIDDDALAPDNRWRAPVELRDAFRVGVVAPARFGRAERVDKLEPAAWLRLALAPREQGAGVDVADVEPAALDQARLATLDAVVLPRPDLVPDPAWPRLRAFVESGGLVLVMPPAGVNVHLWGDAFAKAMGLDWSLERENRDAAARAVRRAPARTALAAGPGAQGPGLLSLIEGELDELLRPVRVDRLLPVRGTPERGDVLLELDDGSPLLWAGPVGPAPSAATPQPDAKPADAPPGRGLLVYLGVALDLEWSDLPAKPLMLPLLQEVVRQGVGKARGTFAALAGSKPGVPGRSTELQELADPGRVGERASPGAPVRILPGPSAAAEPLRRAGVWRAVDDRGTTRGLVVVNPDAHGTRTAAQTRDAVGAVLARTGGDAATPGAPTPASAIAWIPDAAGAAGAAAGVESTMTAVLGQSRQGPSFALPLLIACLVLAVAEIFLARRASHADTLDTAPTVGPSPRAEAA